MENFSFCAVRYLDFYFFISGKKCHIGKKLESKGKLNKKNFVTSDSDVLMGKKIMLYLISQLPSNLSSMETELKHTLNCQVPT